jgi:hypothetical protein
MHGQVEFAHGSGSSRCIPRSGQWPAALVPDWLASLLQDQLTPGEDDSAGTRLHLPLLTGRPTSAIEWQTAMSARPRASPVFEEAGAPQSVPSLPGDGSLAG